MTSQTASFIVTVIAGVATALGLVIASALMGSTGALGFALASSGLIYVSQSLFTSEYAGTGIACQFAAVVCWVAGFLILVF